MSITYDSTTGLRALLGGNLVSDIDTGFLSLAQDVAAALGHSMQEGVIDAGSFETTQASGGAGLTLDVASNVGTGAFVQNDSATGLPLVYLPPTGAKSSVIIGTAHATLPRVDRVVVSTAGVVSVVAGTATSGATLDNLTGATAVPSNALLLADALVPATDTTISNNQIRDRRKWARGAFATIGDFTTYSTSSTTIAAITAKQIRVECSGAPLRVTLIGDTSYSGANNGLVDLFIDGATATSSGQFTPGSGSQRVVHQWVITPAAGSHLLAPAHGVFTAGTLTTDIELFYVEEILRQRTGNNINTTG